MKKIALILLLVPLVLFAQDNLQKGDELLAKRDSVETIKKAMDIFEKELSSHPYEAGWRLMKAIYHFGDMAGVSKEEKKRIYQKGIKIGEGLVKNYPDRVEAHFWLGVLYGVYGEVRGVMKSLFLVKPIKREMNAVLRLDEKYDCGGAHRVLGRLYYKVPGFFGGSKKKSLEHLLKSKEICPNNLLTRYYLAETLVKLKRKEEAIKELREALTLEPLPEDKPEEAKQKAEIKALLEKLEKKK